MSDAQILVTIKYDTKPIDVFRLIREIEDQQCVEDVEVRVD